MQRRTVGKCMCWCLSWQLGLGKMWQGSHGSTLTGDATGGRASWPGRSLWQGPRLGPRLGRVQLVRLSGRGAIGQHGSNRLSQGLVGHVFARGAPSCLAARSQGKAKPQQTYIGMSHN